MELSRFGNLIRDLCIWRALRGQWMRVRRQPVLGEAPAGNAKALIIPCDPWGVVGSRGDQAMILACVQHIRAVHSDRVIEIMTDAHDTDAACRALGLVPTVTWREPLDAWFAAHAGDYAEVYIPGADVTDGVYGWPTACRLLAFYDCFAARGVPVHYLGFSWSETPHPMLKRVLKQLTAGLPLPVRDPVSLERLSRFTAHRPLVPVADAAFCLQPRESARVQAHRAWIDACHAEGKIVVALNVHNMFNEAETKSDDWDASIAAVLNRVLAARPDVNLLLLPHDDRPRVSDLAVLKRLAARFDPRRCKLVDEVMDADEIKSLVSYCEGLIAGRMHLSIAALGQGVPVMGLVYQGKFEGLWNSIGLGLKMLIDPVLFLKNSDEVYSAIINFILIRDVVKSAIVQALPRVLELSRKNFL